MTTFHEPAGPEPGDPDDIVYPEPNTTGEGEMPYHNGAAMLAVRLALRLKEIREAKGMRIEEVSERSGLDLETLTRLETGRISNPKIDTLYRYALAVGCEIEAQIVPLPPEYQD